METVLNGKGATLADVMKETTDIIDHSDLLKSAVTDVSSRASFALRDLSRFTNSGEADRLVPVKHVNALRALGGESANAAHLLAGIDYRASVAFTLHDDNGAAFAVALDPSSGGITVTVETISPKGDTKQSGIGRITDGAMAARVMSAWQSKDMSEVMPQIRHISDRAAKVARDVRAHKVASGHLGDFVLYARGGAIV